MQSTGLQYQWLKQHILSFDKLAYVTPSVIPSSAEEVLLLASVIVGPNVGGLHYIKIYTQQNSVHYEKYLMIHTWSHVAANANSDNPMTTSRQVFVESLVAHTGYLRFYLHAIEYRWLIWTMLCVDKG